MSIPNLNIKIVRFIVDTYGECVAKYAYCDLGNHIRKAISKLNDKSTFDDILNAMNSIEDEKISEILKYSKNVKIGKQDFIKEFKANILSLILKEMK